MSADAPVEGAAALEDLKFDNATLKSLPLDRVVDNYVRQQVRGACFSKVSPTPLEGPKLVAASLPALGLIDIGPDQVARPDFAEYFCGNKVLPGAVPAAHCYCGHQFGHFSGQLGDGATMYLGEVINGAGERWEVQFKGAGKTPYSRTADGRKVLRSTLREFLCSEAMFHLGVPTTRAATCVTSDSKVVRDVFYDGNAAYEPCAVVMRIAPTFLRFGSFEIFRDTDAITGRTGPSRGLEAEMLPKMLDHTVKNYYPEIWTACKGDEFEADDLVGKQHMYTEFFKELVQRTARLVAQWQAVGWCHGVLNTDNMSIVGVTIDYGPFGFMDRYDPDFICNGSDNAGRYDYKSQPEICRWNCGMLADSIAKAYVKAVGDSDPNAGSWLRRLQRELQLFDEAYDEAHWKLMRQKLGLTLQDDYEKDVELINGLLSVMESTGADWTDTFRCLSSFPMPAKGGDGSGADAEHADGGVLDHIMRDLPGPEVLAEAAQPRIPRQQLSMLQMLAMRDPQVLAQLGLSTSMLQAEAARAERADRLAAVTPPQKAEKDRALWKEWLQRYGTRLAREADAGVDAAERVKIMNAANPRYVLRNWVAQKAIEAAEAGDFSEVHAVLERLQNPFTDDDVVAQAAAEAAPAAAEPSGSCRAADYVGPPPAEYARLAVT